EKRPGLGVGARAAATANRVVAAFAAPALERRRIAQLFEHLGRGPDVPEALHAGVAGGDQQVAARIDAPFVRDEADAGPGEATARHGREMLAGPAAAHVRTGALHKEGRRSFRLRAGRDKAAGEVAAPALVLQALGADPVIVRRAGRLEVDRTAL